VKERLSVRPETTSIPLMEDNPWLAETGNPRGMIVTGTEE
jgi:hypothetical protein